MARVSSMQVSSTDGYAHAQGNKKNKHTRVNMASEHRWCCHTSNKMSECVITKNKQIRFHIGMKMYSVCTCLLQGRGVVSINTVQGALWTVNLRGDCQWEIIKKTKKQTKQKQNSYLNKDVENKQWPTRSIPLFQNVEIFNSLSKFNKTLFFSNIVNNKVNISSWSTVRLSSKCHSDAPSLILALNAASYKLKVTEEFAVYDAGLCKYHRDVSGHKSCFVLSF